MGYNRGLRSNPAVWQEVLDMLHAEYKSNNQLLLNDAIMIVADHYNKSQTFGRSIVDKLRLLGKIETRYLSTRDRRVEICNIDPNLTEEECAMHIFDKSIGSMVSKRIEEEKRLSYYRRLADNCRKQIDELTTKILSEMQENGVVSTVSQGYQLKLRRRPQSIIIEDESLLPEQAFKIKKEPSKTAIKKLIKKGINVQGAKIDSQGDYVQISMIER